MERMDPKQGRGIKGFFLGMLGLVILVLSIDRKNFSQGDGPASVVRPVQWTLEKSIPQVQMLLPGFQVRELLIELTNLNNITYAPDGRLFAAGYDGRLHLLLDSNGDGLEDSVKTFHDRISDDYPLGIAFHDGALYVCRRYHIARHADTNADGVPDTAEVAATGWRSEVIDKDPLYVHRRVDDALGLAISPNGTFYISLGAANFGNGYLVDGAGKSQYQLNNSRGSILKISADGKNRSLFATGLRFVVSMGINRQGDLFATDQEGATWLPNGNPFDELLQIQQGKHYGFPPRHPKYLPNVIDEPSVHDYGPQRHHQSRLSRLSG